MKNQTNRNGVIELWRFILIGAIGVMHFSNSYYGTSPYLGGAYVATEFFFIVSGYLLLASFYKNKTRGEKTNAWQFTLHRVKNLYPCYLFSFLVLFCFIMVQERASLNVWISNLSQSIWELTFLQISGLKGFRLFNYPAWYISAMLIVGYFIYALLELEEEKFTKIIMPFSVLFIYCFFSKNSENIDVWGGAKILSISDALMRAFAGMCLGGICYQLSQSMKERAYSFRQKAFITVIEWMAYVTALILMNNQGHTQLDFYIIALLATGVTLSFSNVSYRNRFFSNSLLLSSGKLSLVMFLNQILVIGIIGTYVENLGYKEGILIFITGLIFVSLIEIFIIRGLKYLKNKAL